jgi:CRP-like cAMP-binding protein
LFKEVRECEIKRILLLSKPLRYIKNTMVLRQGEVAEAVFVVMEGELRLSKRTEGEGRSREIMILGKGQIHGWEEVLEGVECECSCVVSSSTAVLLKIAKQLFLSIFEGRVSSSVIRESKELIHGLIRKK